MTSVVHCRREPYDVYIGRAVPRFRMAASKWANPFRRGALDGNRTEVIAKYQEWIRTQPLLLGALSELRGKVLGCWCKPLPCHGDVLVELVKHMEDWEAFQREIAEMGTLSLSEMRVRFRLASEKP